MTDRIRTHYYDDGCPGGHRGQPVEPEGEPIYIRRETDNPVKVQTTDGKLVRLDALRELIERTTGPGYEYATDGGCPHVDSNGDRCDEYLGHWPVEVTLRDLIRFARANRIAPRLECRGRLHEYWSVQPSPRCGMKAVQFNTGWKVSMWGPGARIEMRQPTPQKIADAARLCGWDIGGTPRR